MNESDSEAVSKFTVCRYNSTIFVQENKSFEDMRHELEKSNAILQLDTHLINDAKNPSNIPKFPLEKLKSTADDLPEEVDKTQKEVRTTLCIHFTLRNLRMNETLFIICFYTLLHNIGQVLGSLWIWLLLVPPGKGKNSILKYGICFLPHHSHLSHHTSYDIT